MNRKLLFGILVTGTLLATQLIAQPHPQPGSAPPKPGKMMGDLNEEQQAKVQSLRLQLEKEALPLKAKRESLDADLKAAMTADSFDEGKVRKVVEQMHAIEADLQMLHLRHQRDVRNLLTPEQREKFDLQLLSGKPGPDFGPPPHHPERSMQHGQRGPLPHRGQ